MLNFDESLKSCECKSGTTVDNVAKKILCSECGRVFDDDSATTKAASSYDISDQNSQNLGSKPVTADPNTDGSSLPSTENLPHPIIAAMCNTLCIPENITISADAIFKCVEDTSGRKTWEDAFFAACIYTAARLEDDITQFITEICLVSSGVTPSTISKEIEFIAKELKLPWLMNFELAGLVKRFCFALEMDEETIIAALEAAKSDECVNSPRSVDSVAAMIIYVISQFSDKNKYFKEISEVTGVEEKLIRETHKDLYDHLMTIAPECYAYAFDYSSKKRFTEFS